MHRPNPRRIPPKNEAASNFPVGHGGGALVEVIFPALVVPTVSLVIDEVTDDVIDDATDEIVTKSDVV